MMIKHTGEFDLAYRFVSETNQNIFLTGKAGTGKTTFLKYLRENTSKNCVVTAPTGVAAINARGVTLHSLFQLPFGIILPDSDPGLFGEGIVRNHPLLSKIHYNRDKLDLLRNLELLIIDEASMVASYTVDAIDTILRNIRRKPHYSFGGVQVLFIGDLYQLPPVVKREEWEILDEFYNSVFFFDSYVLRDNIPVIIELKEIFRQEDSKFIDILNGIRNNNISEENFGILNSRLISNFIPKDNEEYITLTTHNFQSDEINRRRLDTLPGYKHVFYAEVIDEFPENSFPAEKELKLKVGSQVMFLKNDTEGRQYFNGKIGTITELDLDYIKVKCKDNYNEIEVKKSEWQNIRYKINPDTKEITEEVMGSFIQYPLRLAWSITIHKSQGLTFNKLIVDAERAFAKGQVYVALSRGTSLEGLILKSPVYRNFLGAHKDFKEWQKENINDNLSQRFIESRQEFMLEELQDIFTWQNWYYNLVELKELLVENQDKINVESNLWLTDLMMKQKELYEVSEKFKQTIAKLSRRNSLIEENEMLQQRIKDGAIYFHNEIMKWNEHFTEHPFTLGIKKVAVKIDNLLIEIADILEEILHKINFCKNGFLLDDYLKNGKIVKIKVKDIRSSYSKSSAQKKNTVAETVRLLRETKSIQLVAEFRNLTQSTIEGHIAKAIGQNLIEIEEVIPIDEVKKIAEYFPDELSDVQLSPVKEKAPSEISYGKLRIVLAWLQKEKLNLC